MTTCSICNEPIEPGHTYLEEVTGWVKYRGRTGGANAVAYKKPTGRVAHNVCLPRAEMPVHQVAML